ncbi:hypothetical protein [Stakelama tenebrarum]|uniref:Spore coat protein U domain-containing protein n=1 Tax=Stakelama tenebrarum TaxID=2711215 RepID=A0A6G6Y290_9SPHN|nr:hypothetical protein [Sphingosinithalassobacter tenebrarum]QIG79042.1 hypothetical protein G5C33_04085 [Sphingosinithalassobacter tenebrarum]
MRCSATWRGVFGGWLMLVMTAPAAAQLSQTTGPIEIGGEYDSECRIEVGEVLSDSTTGGNLAVVPLEIACNSAFTIHGSSGLGAFLVPDADAPDGFARLRYQVEWPASLVDGGGSSIAPGFTADGEAWQGGLHAVSGATREPQSAVMIIRYQAPPDPEAQVIPDIFIIELEQN